ncbi:hypothetical protein COJ85_20465 [Bacillus sp. AFS076308]|uniref:MTH1187 family thiamine-binding protein n=1 Tax=unclassified Bacillus (in: firmicutes) TaxID=185979 RepID=UPI000BF90845|nr:MULTISPECIES: MTH1187 family thiamine-binding protein [unclassified Bacillus (in: firmicutes)]PFN98749.1 hypothetical protein COJ85_20465 [Bacillus sp. AFS076308]PGV53472.1 hypothetical protein COD92_07780 [Bacillus sp. AFS037270]
MPLLEISVVPIGTDSPSFSTQVTNAVRIIEEKDLKYELTPTSTVVEGDIDHLWEVAKEIHQKAISNGPERIVTNISIDHRTDKEMNMDHQIDTVRKELE